MVRPTLALLAALFSCSDSPADLIVDVRTDLVPTREFNEIETELFRTVPGDLGIATRKTSVTDGEANLIDEGLRAAEYRELEPGLFQLRISLKHDGDLVLRRDLAFRFYRSMVVALHLTRNCVDKCNGGNCLNGFCVSPQCSAQAGYEDCGFTPCSNASDCTDPTPAACAEPVCQEGLCFLKSNHQDCHQWCHPEQGCAGEWWNEDWKERVRVTVTNDSQTDMEAGYQVRWHDQAGAMSDLIETEWAYHTLRLVPDNEKTEIMYNLEQPQEGSGFVWLWFPLHAPLPSGQSVDYYIYGGNADAPEPPYDRRDLFVLFNDFDEIDADEFWTKGDVAQSETRPFDRVVLTGQNGYLQSVVSFPPGQAVDFKAHFARLPNQSLGLGTGSESADHIVLISGTGGAPTTSDTTIGPLISVVAEEQQTVALPEGYAVFSVARWPTKARFRIGETEIEVSWNSELAEELPIRIESTAGADLVVDWVRVRHLVDPEPRVEAGTVERLPSE